MSAPPLYPDPSEFPQKEYPPPYEAGMQSSPPPPGFYQPPVQAAPVLMAEQPQPQPQPQVIVLGTPALGPHKAKLTCQNCQKEMVTRTDKKPSIVAFISSGVLCIFGCFLGCCFIPFCVESCKDTHHSCSECGLHLGRHRAFF